MTKVSVLALLAAALLAHCGSVIEGTYNDGGRPFDFRHPDPTRCPVKLAPAADGQVDLRYLGAGAVYIGWSSGAILLGPFFSNPGLLTAQFCNVQFDKQRIATFMTTLPTNRIRAVLAGHSHYDHLGDIPFVMQQYLPGRPVYTNDSGRNMLAFYRDDLHGAIEAVSLEHDGGWVRVRGAPIRFLPLLSDHAPQLCGCRRWPCTYADCDVDKPWTDPFEKHRLRDLCGGQPLAYVIDLLDGNDRVRFRIYYNDAAATAGAGVPPAYLKAEHGFDLAILAMTSWDFVDRYPRVLLRELAPGHVLVAHYENFFSKWTDRWSFAPLLTNGKANGFMETVKDQLEKNRSDRLKPANPICGVTTDRWTMPVPGSQLLFSVISGTK